MSELEKLEVEAAMLGLTVEYVHFKSDRLFGLCVEDHIFIRTGMTSAETADILAEELEHYRTTYGNILDMDDVSNRKQERLARIRAYDRRIGLEGIVKGYKRGCQNLYELADYLDVSEECLADALKLYREKYGCGVELWNYTIMFEPNLTVIERK